MRSYCPVTLFGVVTCFPLQMLLVHYLGVLVRELCACDLHPLALPALLLQLATSECLIAEGSRPLCQLIHMRCVVMCAYSQNCLVVLMYVHSYAPSAR